MTDAIDAMIDAATAAPKQETAPEANATATAPETPETPETNEGDEGADSTAKKKYTDPWPKSALDVMNRKDKKIAKRDEQIAQYQKQLQEKEAEIAKYKAPKQTASDPSDPEPDLKNYSDWSQYNRDMFSWNMRQVERQKASQTPAPNQAAVDPQQQVWVAQRAQHAEQKWQQIQQSHPELATVLEQNADVLRDFPETTKHALLKSDEPALAVLAMAVDGTLDDLGEMSPALAEKYIARAVIRGKSMLGNAAVQTPQDGQPAQAPPPVSSAPAPMSQPRAPSRSGKSGIDLPDAEFRKKYGV